ncbi:MAG TPA: acyl carrier protein [Bacteroidia bacterium]|jgi:acyl carrier protein|nr:acyl carrier protein [Bacteroidia bacterium]
MNTNEILSECNKIFIDQLDNPAIALKRETTAATVDEWDSLTHIQLVVAVEKHFKIRFTTAEIQGFINVGAMCDTIEAKLNSK